MKPRVLLVTNLYPNSREPVRGLYIRQLVDFLAEDHEIQVVAPVPWAPAWLAARWRPSVVLPREETIGGIRVHHPRYLAIPKVLRFTHGLTFSASMRHCLHRLRQQFAFDLISVHWIFPDAYGTVRAARGLGIPVVAHAQGCDINDYIRYPLRRRMICSALREADSVVTKSGEIAGKITGLGIDANKVHVVYNGINRDLFQPRDKQEQRRKLGLPAAAKTVLFIGNLSPEKGIDHLLRACAELRDSEPSLSLVIVGDGPLRAEIETRAGELGIADATTLLGRLGHEQIPSWLNAADVLCLPSLREGCPNVVLEALASGTAVVASAVGAIPEMMQHTRLGFMAPPGDARTLAAQLARALALPAGIDRSFDWYSWRDNARALAEVFADAVARRLAAEQPGPGSRPAPGRSGY